MRKAVSAVIFQNDNLLIFRKNKTWILPGGKPKENESDFETLKREFSEEASGAEIEIGNFYCKFVGETPHRKDFLEAIVYFANLKYPDKTIITSAEINEAKYFGYFEILNLNLSDITRGIVNKLIKDNYF